jgi:hypothetical protein
MDPYVASKEGAEKSRSRILENLEYVHENVIVMRCTNRKFDGLLKEGIGIGLPALQCEGVGMRREQ